MIQLGKAKAGLDIEESKENQGVDQKSSYTESNILVN